MARAESGILGPIQGWLTDRFGPRALIRVGMTVFGIGFMLFSQIRSPATFIATYFLMALGSSLGGFLPVTVAIVNWFRRRRALALSISATGMATGGLIVQGVVLALSRFGWRWTAFASGILVLLIGLPIAQVVRHRPEPYGHHVDGSDGAVANTASRSRHRRSAIPAPVDFTPREAMGTRAFWLISAGHAAALLGVSAVMVHLIVHVTERLGYSLRQAAAVLALMTVLQVIGQLVGGWAGDRWSKRLIASGCMLGHAIALAMLAVASTFGMVVGFAILHGLAWGARGPLMGALRADYFGGAAFGTITGFSSMIAMLGMMGGPLLAGILADRTGSYQTAFTVLAAMAALGSVFFLLAVRPAPPHHA
jgi:sugar phosphate permease